MNANNARRCPICRTLVTDKVLECPVCSYSLLVSCDSCQTPNPIYHNFCSNCGRPQHAPNNDEPDLPYADLQALNDKNTDQLIKYASDVSRLYSWQRRLEKYLPDGLLDKLLAADDALVGERRYVTVLFSDMVGFTKLSSGLDPEDVFLLMNSCFQVLVEQVYQYGGTVDKFIGDGMMAIFGAPISYGNDSERAVRAALGMQEAISDLNVTMEPKLGKKIEIRIGLTSGDVIAGTVGSEGQRSYTVMGSTVNMASRLETAAQPGTIFVNEDIYFTTREFFRFEVLSPISVKGIDQPVPAYQVIGPVSDAQTFHRFAVDQLAPFIGRENELKQLQQLTDDPKQIQGHIAFITGDVGLGKTRLLWEWQKDLPGSVSVWAGSAQSVSQQGYEVWQQMLMQGLNLQGLSKRKVRQKLNRYVDDSSWVPFIETLLLGEVPEDSSLGSLRPEQLKEQMFIGLRQVISRVARRKPLILILDNLQWFDSLSRDLLRSLMSLSRDLPLIFCLTGRTEARLLPELREHAATLLSKRIVNIKLSPLSTEESRKLLALQFPLADVSEELRTYILQRAQNNPYYLEELVSLIISSDFIEKLADPDVSGADVLAKLSLPGTLRGLVRAQIDRLPEIEQQILAYITIVGASCSASLLVMVLKQYADIENVSAHLNDLVKQGILTFDGEDYHFVHNIMQETIYQGLLTGRRRQMHRQLGEAIEARAADDVYPHLEQLAHHFSAAEMPDKAVPYLVQAGEKMRQRFANESAFGYLSAALDMLPNVPESAHFEPLIHKTMGDIYRLNGDYDLALVYYHRALGAAEAGNQQADHLRLVGRTWQLKGQTDKAQSWLEKAMLASRDDDTPESRTIQGRIYADMGRLHLAQGQYFQAERWSEEAVKLLDKTEALSDLARSLNGLSEAYYHQNRWYEASEQLQRAYKINKQIGNRLGLANTLTDLGRLQVVEGDWAKAIDTFQQAITQCEQIGVLERTLGNAHNQLAYIYVHQGILDEAEKHLKASHDIRKKLDSTFELADLLNTFALSRIVVGNYSEAEKYVQRSIKLAAQHNELTALSHAHRLMSRIKVAQGDLASAEDHCNEAMDLASSIGSVVQNNQSLRQMALIQFHRQELDRAFQTVKTSFMGFGRSHHVYEMARTQVLMAQIALARGDRQAYETASQAAYPVLEELNAIPELASLQLLELEVDF